MQRRTHPTVGVIDFQGDVREHVQAFGEMGITVKRVRSCNDMADLTHLVLPGGESSVIGKFLAETKTDACIKDAYERNKIALWGTCAGVVLLTKSGSPWSLNLADATVERNAYGSQLHSFSATLKLQLTPPVAMEGIFIRAPKITAVGKEVAVLAAQEGSPVLCKQGNMLLCTFHPELTTKRYVHELFLSMIASHS
ncbi:MAG: pyridoxal 5'-phosphate synthase glutaminase subunit PdxT [Candidatus Peribacteraceae bacterium]|nr:pyridoxal 5'-phosphate synthase glutaminase subunit PdxT [Candidatus Peribacteraceae bacterium]